MGCGGVVVGFGSKGLREGDGKGVSNVVAIYPDRSSGQGIRGGSQVGDRDVGVLRSGYR